jgi:hypothetical protein
MFRDLVTQSVNVRKNPFTDRGCGQAKGNEMVEFQGGTDKGVLSHKSGEMYRKWKRLSRRMETNATELERTMWRVCDKLARWRDGN